MQNVELLTTHLYARVVLDLKVIRLLGAWKRKVSKLKHHKFVNEFLLFLFYYTIK